jgi:hypothetical protein
VARGGPRRGIGGGPIHHARLKKVERLAGPSVPSLATPHTEFDLPPRFLQRAERRCCMRLVQEAFPPAVNGAVFLLKTGAEFLIGPMAVVVPRVRVYPAEERGIFLMPLAAWTVRDTFRPLPSSIRVTLSTDAPFG